MLFDPILNESISGSDTMVRTETLQPMFCSHCNMPIKGKFHQSGENYYDDYCWQFKFVIDSLFIARGSRRGMKDLDDNEC
jgi:hypothetical protein